MFLENRYKKIYYKLVERARNRTLKGYKENHHIIPKSLGGKRTKTNLVYLTAKEHYICHLLLMKMVKEPAHKKSMAFALFRFGQSDKLKERKMNARSFEKYRQLYGENCSGKNNPFYGKTHSKKSIKIIRQKNIEWNKNHGNSFLGKHHTNEYKENSSNRVSIPITVEFYDGKKINFKNRLELGTYLGKSKVMGAKLVHTKEKKITPKPGISIDIWKKYNIKNIWRTNVN
jgi:hypothetical protein